MSIRTRLEAAEHAALYAQQTAKNAVDPEDQRAERLRANADKIREQNISLLLQVGDATSDEREVLAKRISADHLSSPDLIWSELQCIRAESCILAQILVGKTGEFQNKVFDWMHRNCDASERLGLDGGAKCRYAVSLIESDE